jgi:LytS/YehU family sensor histidine kinase
MIPLSEDLDTLEKYLRVEQLRFEFKWMMDIDPALDLDQIEFPPMLLQPVVENAIKHGISEKGNQGLLVIAIQKRNNDLIIDVEDNGGTQKNTTRKANGNGYGLQLTRDRIERLRELYKTDNISFVLRHQSNSSKATYYFENWIQAYENSYH